MKEKVFKTIFNLVTRGALSEEEAYYLLELLFKEKEPYWIYNPHQITYTTTSPDITPNKSGTGDLSDWWDTTTTGGQKNLQVYTTATNSAVNSTITTDSNRSYTVTQD